MLVCFTVRVLYTADIIFESVFEEIAQIVVIRGVAAGRQAAAIAVGVSGTKCEPDFTDTASAAYGKFITKHLSIFQVSGTYTK
jgi:hypothetical protein